MSSADPLYFGREQSQVKHEVLRGYLERFAHIIGSWSKSITYIDGFAGPWNAVDKDLKDSSFAIALRELGKARDSNRARGKTVRIRCFFVESVKSAYSALSTYSTTQTDVKDVEIRTRNSQFEDVIADALAFIREDPETFAFAFIDPTGWKGIALEKIRPLLTVRPGEVLVNLMTSHLTRHIENPNASIRQQIADVFGSHAPLDRMKQLEGMDRIDACVDEYCSAIQAAGAFLHVCPAIVLQPTKDRPHFHLIYGSRHPLGLEVFKATERKAMQLMEKTRAGAQERKRREKGSQMSFLDPDDMPPSKYYSALRDRYLARARSSVEALLRSTERLAFDQAWALALKQPLVWESDLQEWIGAWKKDGSILIEGLQRERIPKREKGHFLIWTKA